jgi:ABC-2 type transport system ATP-binding protein
LHVAVSLFSRGNVKNLSVVVSGLSKMYGEQKAVDRISFEAKAGEVLGFLGPNGAGKSTTMKIICGYLPPTEGTVTVSGFDVEQLPLEAKKQIGYLPENNPLYLDLYVKEFLLYAARLSGVKKPVAKVKQLVNRIGLVPEQHKKIRMLSKGYRQRVGLAQALLHDPQVLVMDEPTAGLDPNQLIEIRNLIKELGTEKTIILSTHIMQEVEAVCSRAVIIHKGKIVADDEVGKLQALKSGSVIIRVAFKQPVETALLKKINGVKKVESAEPNVFLLHSAFNNEEEVFQFAVEQKNIITSMSHEVAGLEEIFMELTRER